MKRILTATIAAVALLGASVSTASANDKNFGGALLGAAAGGFVGSQFGRGDGQLAATAFGTLIGAAIGSSWAQPAYAAPAYRPAPVSYYHPTPYYQPAPVYRAPTTYVDQRTYIVQRTYVNQNTRVVQRGHDDRWDRRGRDYDRGWHDSHR